MSFTSAVSHGGADHLQWIKEIEFYKDEFNVFTKRLEEIVRKNTDRNVMAEAEHFQNQFIIQQNNIDEIKHSVTRHSSKVAADSKEHAGRIKTLLVIEHEDLQNRMAVLEKSIRDIRNDFNKFLSKWM